MVTGAAPDASRRGPGRAASTKSDEVAPREALEVLHHQLGGDRVDEVGEQDDQRAALAGASASSVRPSVKFVSSVV